MSSKSKRAPRQLVAMQGDSLQTSSMQMIEVNSSTLQKVQVQNCGYTSQLADAKGIGACRLAITIPGAFKNETGGTTFVEERGNYYDMARRRRKGKKNKFPPNCVMIKNKFPHAIDFRYSQPYSSVIGSGSTNVRTSLKIKSVKPGGTAVVPIHIDTRSNQHFPPVSVLEIDAKEGSKTVKVKMNTMAILDYAVIIPDAPPSTGPLVESADLKISTTPADWSDDAEVCELTIMTAMKCQKGVVVTGTRTDITAPTVVITAHDNLHDIKETDPISIINYGAAPSAVANALLKGQIISPKVTTPDFIVVSDGTGRYLKAEQIEVGGKAMFRLVSCDYEGENPSPVVLRAIEDANNRLIGPGVCWMRNQAKPDRNLGMVLNQYGFDFTRGEWMLYHNGAPFVTSYDAQITDGVAMNKATPLLYFSINGKTADDLPRLDWGKVVASIIGTIKIAAYVISALGL